MRAGLSREGNLTTVDLGSLRLSFSYDVLVSLQVEGGGRLVRQNEWGVTTGKHLNKIDGGTPAAVEARLPRDQFRESADAVLARYGIS